jgi:hypothetical protein
MRPAVLAASLLLLACAPKEEAPAPEAAPPPPPAPTVADFAGTWNATTTLPGSQPVETQIVVNADGTGQMIAAGRDPVPLTLSINGDSLIAVSGEYESLLRKGTKVTIRVANHRGGDELHSNVIATYKSASGEEVVNGTMTAKKAP